MMSWLIWPRRSDILPLGIGCGIGGAAYVFLAVMTGFRWSDVIEEAIILPISCWIGLLYGRWTRDER